MPRKQPTYPNPATFNVGTYDAQHKKNLAARAKKVERLYKQAIQKMAAAAQPSLFGGEAGQQFSWQDFPVLDKEMAALQRELAKGLQLNIEQGDKESWALSNAKNDAMVASIVGKSKIPKAILQTWNEPNLRAMNAFIQRRDAGMGLSHRVWNLTDQFKAELELALETCIGKGMSAADISREVRQYLKYPDKLFRRVRDEQGNLRLSKAAAAFHPGQGVYRSSYKNALRMTATENNMAYRSADHERWGNLPFVLGIKISTSNNHPITDICDELSGRYPKDFKFVGWHPWCRCFAVAILADQKEMDAYTKALMDGQDVSNLQFTGEVKEMPEQWNTWMKENAERIGKAAKAGKLPYFIKDNFTDGDPTKGLKWMSQTPQEPKKLTPLQIAAKRHAERTPEEAQRILHEYRTKQAVTKYGNKVLDMAKGITDISNNKLRKALSTADYTTAEKEAKAIAAKLKQLKGCQYVENPIAASKSYSMKEVMDADKAIADKMKHLATKTLAEQKGAIEYEIQWVKDHKKYSTWPLAETAYTKQLAVVEDLIEWEGYKAKLQELAAFKTKDKSYLLQIQLTEQSIVAKNKQFTEKGLKHLQDIKAKKEAAKVKKAQANTTASAPKKLDPGNTTKQSGHIGDAHSLTEQEMKDLIMRDTGCSAAMAQRYYDAVYGFSYQWDWEIRQFQTGNIRFTSRHGHTMKEIERRAYDLEKFIHESPKWDGGTTYRGMSLSDKELDELITKLKKGESDMLGSASWTTKQGTSEGFADYHIGETSTKYGDEKTNSVVLITDTHSKATSIQHISHYGSREAEVLSSKDTRWEFVRKYEKEGYTYIVVKPAN